MGTKPWPASERDIARPIVAWLQDQQWDVFQEVQPARAYEHIADILAVRGSIVWVVETKRTLGLSVMEQAAYWTRYAHYVSIGVPVCRNSDDRYYAKKVLRYEGVGLLLVNAPWPSCDPIKTVREEVAPALHRTASAAFLRGNLTDQQRTYAEAGNAEGQRWTPFQETCDQIRRFVRTAPGATLTEVMENIKHHYRCNATARACIPKWAQQGQIRGVRCRRDGRLWRFYLDEEAESRSDE